jgi:DNA polymerase-1
MKQEIHSLDFETTEVPYFNRKGKNKLDSKGHPRFAKAVLFSASDGNSAIADIPAKENLPPLKNLVTHNISFDGLVGIRNGFWSLEDLWSNLPHCTSLASKVLRNDRNAQLKELAKVILNVDAVIKYDEVNKYDKEAFTEYAKNDALYAAQLFPIFKKQLEDTGQWKLYREIELPFALVNMECELNGLSVDIERLRGKLSETKRLILEIEKGVSAENLNFNSPKQMKRFLYGDLNLPLSFLKGKLSVSKKALSCLDHPIVRKIQERQVANGVVRQLETILRFTDKDSNLIFPYINSLGADTGRCTSSNPNLQNISKESVVRELFICSPKHKIIVLDFGQIEPRVLAHFLPSGGFRSLFNQDGDFYSVLASTVFTSGASTVPARAIAKQAVLGVMYGLGPKTMSENLKCSELDASEYLEKFYTYFPEILDFKNSVLESARSSGFAEGLLNRRRFIENLHDPDKFKRFSAERETVNAVIQGSAATIFKYKVVKLREALPRSVRFLLHVHDEIVMEAPESIAEEILKVSKQLLEKPLSWFSVPLIADGGVGSNWAQAKGA